jgi:hypothetical protein
MWLLYLLFWHWIHQVVNMEWGNFWSSHLPRTPYDLSLDDETQNRNDQVIFHVKILWNTKSLVSTAEHLICH